MLFLSDKYIFKLEKLFIIFFLQVFYNASLDTDYLRCFHFLFFYFFYGIKERLVDVVKEFPHYKLFLSFFPFQSFQ